MKPLKETNLPVNAASSKGLRRPFNPERVGLHPSFLRAAIAHRGLHDISKGRPENSRASIQAAIASGYGIEIDLQASRDNKAMVFHDTSLGRLTQQKGSLKHYTAAELQKIPLKHAQETIPTFADILTLVDGKAPLLVEIKDQSGGLGPLTGAFEQEISRLIARYRGQIALMSFNPHSIEKCARFSPKIARGLVTGAFRTLRVPYGRRKELRRIPDFERLGCSFISHGKGDLTRSVVNDVKAKGGNILCWTIKSASEETRARAHADNITFEKYHPKTETDLE